MANITGTNGNDTLTATNGDDVIKGLGGNDTIITSGVGNDFIDGGAGSDVVDYSSNTSENGSNVRLNSNGSFLANHLIGFDTNGVPTGGTDTIVNVETIIGNAASSFSNGLSFSNAQKIDVDLSKNRVTYSVASIGTKTLTVKNFSNVIGSPGNDKIKVNGVNGLIAGGDGDDVIIGGKGGYLIYGNGNSRSLPPNEKNTIDYSDLGTSLSLRVLGEYDNDDRRLFVDKSSGRDQINQFQKIIGARNQTNTIDAHTDDGSTNQTRIDVNLAENSLKRISLFAPNPVQQFEVVNFVNFVGSKQNDTIVGANKNGKLTGGGGNDTITGGNKNDIITGSDSTARGVGEVDTLTGGGGRDKFVLGDEKGAYYVGKGANDYALITDFNLFKDSISIGSLKDYSFALEGTNTIDLYSGKDVNTRDLIAKIQIAGGISSVASNTKSVMSADASLNAIVGKLDIVSAA